MSAPEPACNSLTSGRCLSPPGLRCTTCRRSSRMRREAGPPWPPGAPRSRSRDCMGPGALSGTARGLGGPAASRAGTVRQHGEGDRKRHPAESAGNSFPRGAAGSVDSARPYLALHGPGGRKVPAELQPKEPAPSRDCPHRGGCSELRRWALASASQSLRLSVHLDAPGLHPPFPCDPTESQEFSKCQGF